MSRNNIKRFSPGYQLLYFFAEIYHRFYYRRFKVVDRQKIPKKSPVIFAINHQNALMDALAILFANRSQKVFMARADIFRKKWVARLLYFLKILPAYRIRDGFHSVDQNKDVFKEVIKVLEHNTHFCILPEGNHYGEKRLRPLQKGAARLAFLAEEANGFRLGLSIVPVGLDYSNYYNAGSDLLVIFGDPILVDGYRELYAENPLLAISQLKVDIAEGMKKVMIDISSEKFYKTVFSAIEMYAPVELKKQGLKNTLINNFKVKKQLSEKITAYFLENEAVCQSVNTEVHSYHKKIIDSKLRDRIGSNQRINPLSWFIESLITLLLLPVHLYGMILNYLPYGLPIYLARKIKDRHFLSSIRFVAGMLLFFIWYPLLIIASFFIFDNILLNFVFIISLPITGIFSFYYYIHLLKLRGKFRWMMLRIRNKTAYDELITGRKGIIRKIEEILKNPGL
jgi:1-acyl-sn-glycerol-3-phosphate acyltransferase